MNKTYINLANGGHISRIASSYDFGDNEKLPGGMHHYSIGKDLSTIRALKIIRNNQQALLAVCVEAQLIVFALNNDGSLGAKQYETILEGDGNVRGLNAEVDAKGNIWIMVVDSEFTLNLLNYTNKTLSKRENTAHASFANGAIIAAEKESSKFLILDRENVSNTIKEHELKLEGITHVQVVNDKTLFIFFEESFNLAIYDFDQNINRDVLTNFNFKKATKFEEIFSPSDNMLEEPANYWVSEVKNTEFVFIG